MASRRALVLPFCFAAFVASLTIATTTASALPVSTAFTYQGQVSTKGSDQSKSIKSADIRFALFDRPTGGTQIGATIDSTYGLLVGGRFVARLDFGAAAFTGEARWLEISVRTPSGSGTFTTLSPRQQLSAAPYALYALN